MPQTTSKIVQSLEGIIFTAMVPYGEYLQNEVLLKKGYYTWLVGHLTDIGFAGGTVTWTLMMLNENTKKAALIIPTAITASEILLSIHPKINFDWQDVACFYGTALFSYGINKICDRYF